MSLAELDAQDVTLLPERATLKGGLSVHQLNVAAIFNFGFVNVNLVGQSNLVAVL